MLKKRIWKPIAGILLFVLLISSFLFAFSLIKVDLLITEYLLLILAVIAFFVILAGLLLYYGISRKGTPARRIRRIIGVVLAIITSCGCLYGAVAMTKIESTKTAISQRPESSLSAYIGIYVKKDDAAQTIAEMKDYRFAILCELGSERSHSEYAIARINEIVGAEVETRSYRGITDAAAALRDGEVQAMAVNTIFLALLNDTESLSGFADELRLIEEIPVVGLNSSNNTQKPMKDDGKPSSSSSLDTSSELIAEQQQSYEDDRSYVFFLSGVDSREPGVFSTRSDGNILMLVNPKTRQILLINTPRDTFLQNPALGDGDKLTHCAIQGPYNSIAALERFYGISIDNYVKVNFSGFETIVDTLGGITVDNPTAFDAQTVSGAIVHFDQGTLNLDGTNALAYLRARKAFGSGDLARGQNQMRIIKAIIEKAKSILPSMLLKYQDLLTAFENCLETDLSSFQISDLTKIALKNLSDWEVKSYGITGASGMRVTASGGSEPLYILWPQQNSVDFASKLMNMILNDEIITDELLATAPQ